MKSALILVPLLCLAAAPVYAQCTIDQTSWNVSGGASPPEGVGQSFTACQTGWVTSLSVVTRFSVPTGPVLLQFQPGIAIFPQSAPQSATLTLGSNTIVLDNPFPVSAGDQFSWGMFSTAGALILNADLSGNPYPGGTLLHYNGSIIGEHPTQDYVFTVEITDQEPVGNDTVEFGALKSQYR